MKSLPFCIPEEKKIVGVRLSVLHEIILQWDLICDRRHLRAKTRAVFMVGLIVGALVFGSISDHFNLEGNFLFS